jgi:6-phosphogluconolactonase
MTRAAVPLAALALATAPAASAGPVVCYVSIGGENRVAVYPVAADGSLGEPRSVRLDGAPGSLAVDPAGRLMYAAVRSTWQVATLRIDPADGHLTPVASTKAVENPVYLAIDRSGRHLLTAYYSANKVAVYPLGDNGVPATEPVQVLTTGRNPHSIVGGPGGRVVVPNTGADIVLQFTLDTKAGKLLPGDPPQAAARAGTGPRHLRFHPKLPWAYTADETGSSVTAWSVGERGLTAVQTLSTLPAGLTGKNTCADVELTPDGKYMYVSNRGHDSLAGFAVDATTGGLTPLGQFPTEKTPRDFGIDPSGRFLYAAGQGSGKLAAYRIDAATGKLTQFATYDAGPGAAWVHLQQLPGPAR